MRVTQASLPDIAAASADALAPLQALSPHLLFVFGSPAQLRHPDLTSTLRVGFPTAELVGCSTVGVASGKSAAADSLLLSALSFDHPGLRVISTRVHDTEASHAAGERLGNALRPLGVHTVLVFAPGHLTDGQALMAGLRESLRNAHISGALSSAQDGGQSFTLHNMSVASDQVVAVGFSNTRLKTEESGSNASFILLVQAHENDQTACEQMNAIAQAAGAQHIVAGLLATAVLHASPQAAVAPVSDPVITSLHEN